MNHKKIAELANVSVSTVSKALSGSREVSAELSEKIIKIAIETGYFKEKSKRKLVNNKRNPVLIAVICPEIISIHYTGIITSIKNRIEERGGQTAVYIHDFDNEKMNSIIETLVVKGNVDGIILFSSGKVNSKPDIPIVIASNSEDCPFADKVCTDEGVFFDDVINHFTRLGHTKIGFMSEPLTESKLDTFKKALRKQKINVNPKYIYKSRKRFEEAGCEAAEAFLASEDRPTAVIAAYDEIAMGFISRITKEGVRVPKDVSVAGINDIPSAAYSTPALTTVNLYAEKRHQAAVDLIFERIYGDDGSPRKIDIKPELIIRETTSEVKNG